MSHKNGHNDPAAQQSGTTEKPTKKQVINTSRRKKRPVLLYSGIFVMLLSLISIVYYQPSNADLNNPGVATIESNGSGSQSFNKRKDVSVDEKLATDIAATIAVQARMPIAANVTNLSVSLGAQKDMAQTDDSTIVKPQIIQPMSSNRTVTTYTAKAGDTAVSVAEAHGLQVDTVRWANNLTSDILSVGQELKILPVDGVVYTVKGSDTVDSVAAHYKSTSDRIVAYNDLEVNGIKADTQIIVPGGIVPETERPGYVAPAPPVSNYGGGASYGNSSFYGNATASVGNRYAFGNCTWYAYEMRAQMGRPIGSFWGNASTWAAAARSAGYLVNNTPAVGAIAQWNSYSSTRSVSPYYGHVGIVSAVHGDGTVTITEMNVAGFNRVSSVTLSADRVDNYIH